MHPEAIALEEGLIAKSAERAETAAAAAAGVALLVPTTCLQAARRAKILGPRPPQAARGQGLRLPEEAAAGGTLVERVDTKNGLKVPNSRSSLVKVGPLDLLRKWIALSSKSEYKYVPPRIALLCLCCCQYGGTGRGATHEYICRLCLCILRVHVRRFGISPIITVCSTWQCYSQLLAEFSGFGFLHSLRHPSTANSLPFCL